MGYMHLHNLYKSQDILLMREAYSLEKVHGSSAHISWHMVSTPAPDVTPSVTTTSVVTTGVASRATLTFFSGGESHERFCKLFDHDALTKTFQAMGHQAVTVYGEVYGGKCQGMRETYGPDLRFIAFDVQIGVEGNKCWLSVPDMDQVASSLGLEVVPWKKVSTDLAVLDAERDAPSEVAVRRGCGVKPREGVVIRPLIELTKNNGERIIAKHKQDSFSERATPQKVVDPAKLAVLSAAEAIAQEWVTEQRLGHVLDKLPGGTDGAIGRGMEGVRDVIAAMVEDVYREAAGEVVASKEATAAIGKRTAALFKARLQGSMRAEHA